MTRKFNKREKYLLARLWKNKLEGKKYLKTETLVKEIEIYIMGGVESDARTRIMLEGEVNTMRNLTKKRWLRWTANRRRWATMFRVTEERMHEIMRREIITCKKDAERMLLFLRLLDLKK